MVRWMQYLGVYKILQPTLVVSKSYCNDANRYTKWYVYFILSF